MIYFILPPLSTLHYFPIRFASNCFQNYLFTSKPTPITSHIIFSPTDIIWLYFNFMATSFGSLFLSWPRGSITNFIFGKSLRYHYITSFISLYTLPTYTILLNFLHYLRLFKTLSTSKSGNCLLITPIYSVIFILNLTQM